MVEEARRAVSKPPEPLACSRMTIPVVWSPETRRHEPMREVWVGVPTEGTEVPERVDRILDALAGHDRGRGHAARRRRRCAASTTPAFVEHLRTIHAEWSGGPYDELVGQDRVVPYVFPTAGDDPGHAAHPRRGHARPGRAVRLRHDDPGRSGHLGGGARGRRLRAHRRRPGRARGATRGVRPLPAARPPRHPRRVRRLLLPQQRRGRRAGAAGRRARRRSRSSTSTPTTATAPRRSSGSARDVRYGSLHVDPAAGWFPHYFGHAARDRRGRRRGRHPQPPAGRGHRRRAVARGGRATLADVRRRVPTRSSSRSGVDAAADDPESPLQVTADGYAAAGRLLGSLGVPAVVVQEGGYHLATLGGLVAAYLDGDEHRG